MIEKIDVNEVFTYLTLARKLNEVIDLLNERTKAAEFIEGQSDICKAAKKAAISGSYADLQEYLKLRRRCI